MMSEQDQSDRSDQSSSSNRLGQSNSSLDGSSSHGVPIDLELRYRLTRVIDAIEFSRDFTFDIYESLLRTSLDAGYDHQTVREYLSNSSRPERYVILRHDVDRKPENARDMARLEASLGVSSTYYVRTVDATFDRSIIRDIESLGHEIGYHYEDVDRANGDLERAHDSFEANLDRLRRYATVDTICMHGNPLTKHDNRDMWRDDDLPSLESYGLLGEAYLSMDFTDVTYFSDTGRTWRDGAYNLFDHTVGPDAKRVQVESTAELSSLLESKALPAVCLLTHPNRWARDLPEWVVELTTDTAINVAKTGIGVIR